MAENSRRSRNSQGSSSSSRGGARGGSHAGGHRGSSNGRGGARHFNRGAGSERDYRSGDRDRTGKKPSRSSYGGHAQGHGNSGRSSRSHDRGNQERNEGRRGFIGCFDRSGGRIDKRERGNHQGRQSSANYDSGRRNSDGTVSYPSQNPYTDRRPGEPKMPKGMEWSMLSRDEKERLRGLSKEHAENIGLHMLAAYSLEETDPEAALEHAQWIVRQASRIDLTRETLALIAYRTGDYKLALREFRTAYRMNGFNDYLPFMADCERGLGEPEKAIEMATSDDARYLRGESKAEMFLVYAGALADLGKYDKAVEVAHALAHAQGVGGAYRMRAVQAEQYFNEESGNEDAARALDPLLDRLESEFAEDDNVLSDDVIDNDMENIDDDMLRGLGIDPAEFYRHEDAVQEGSSQAEEAGEIKEAEEAEETEATGEAL